MGIFVIDYGTQKYRVRKELEGCSIFGSQHYIEGDEIMYDILSRIHDNGVTNGLLSILNDYDEDNDLIKKDLDDFADLLIENEILIEMAKEIKKVINEI